MFRLARAGDIDAIMDIVRRTIEIMGAENNPQWSAAYPAQRDFLKDISEDSLFVCLKVGIMAGFFCVNATEPPGYAPLDWQSEEPRFVLHRMAVEPSLRGGGIGREIIGAVEDYSRERGTFYLRTDTFSGNAAMNGLFKNCGFKKAGEVYFRSIERPFFCYDKVLAHPLGT